MFFSAFGFDLFFLLFVIVFVVILVRNLREWSRNNASPRLSVPATVVTKRRSHPVSYTHLDVYKRQALGTCAPTAGSSASI